MLEIRSLKRYRMFSLSAAAVFAVVGLTFLFFPCSVIILFNTISSRLGWPQAPLESLGFYLILATAYMYLVTLLAYLMYRQPLVKCYPFLLSQAKLASSVISLYLFWRHEPYLIYLVNCVVDGGIGLAALYFYRNIKKPTG